MKLGTLKSTAIPDGKLCVVSRDLKKAVKVGHISPSLREAMEKWSEVEGPLNQLYKDLKKITRPNSGSLAQGENPDNSEVA